VDEHHIENVLCPNVPIEEQKIIGGFVRLAFARKDEANDIEDEAIAELEGITSR
jgi:hypothetical protein